MEGAYSKRLQLHLSSEEQNLHRGHAYTLLDHVDHLGRNRPRLLGSGVTKGFMVQITLPAPVGPEKARFGRLLRQFGNFGFTPGTCVASECPNF